MIDDVLVFELQVFGDPAGDHKVTLTENGASTVYAVGGHMGNAVAFYSWLRFVVDLIKSVGVPVVIPAQESALVTDVAMPEAMPDAGGAAIVISADTVQAVETLPDGAAPATAIVGAATEVIAAETEAV
jgi:hypothetical protein